MRPGSLWRLVVRDIRRNYDHFLLSGIGIVVGIATFVFFLALGAGVQQVVLGKIFPIDRLEVVPRGLEVDLGPLRMGMGPDALDDEAVAQIAAIDGVDAVYPKMRLTVPSIAAGGKSLFGSDLRAEIVADGIESELVVEDVGRGYVFGDRDDLDDLRNAGTGSPCTRDAVCPDGMYCLQRKDEERGGCHFPIPVMVSHHLTELYNGGLRRAHGFPKLNPEAALGLTFDLTLGDSMVSGSRRSADEIVTEKVTLVGFSDKAIPIGITLPIAYVERLNAAYGNADAKKQYHSVVVEVRSKAAVARVAQAIDALEFDIQNTGAERAGLLIAILMGVFGTVSVAIIAIAAINIMHVFFMLVYQRQREVGIMRALGATRADIRSILLAQAGVVGLIAGTAGTALAVVASLAFDAISASLIPDFPYKPQSYFDFSPGLVAGALAFAVGFCVLGAALPARRAARTDPATVLVGR